LQEHANSSKQLKATQGNRVIFLYPNGGGFTHEKDLSEVQQGIFPAGKLLHQMRLRAGAGAEPVL